MPEIIPEVIKGRLFKRAGEENCPFREFPDEDTGWGLSDKYKKRPDLIMEAFESDKSSTVGEEDGTGMGMWIVKRTVLEYNGDIDLSENKTLDIGFKISISLGGKYV